MPFHRAGRGTAVSRRGQALVRATSLYCLRQCHEWRLRALLGERGPTSPSTSHGARWLTMDLVRQQKNNCEHGFGHPRRTIKIFLGTRAQPALRGSVANFLSVRLSRAGDLEEERIARPTRKTTVQDRQRATDNYDAIASTKRTVSNRRPGRYTPIWTRCQRGRNRMALRFKRVLRLRRDTGPRQAKLRFQMDLETTHVPLQERRRRVDLEAGTKSVSAIDGSAVCREMQIRLGIHSTRAGRFTLPKRVPAALESHSRYSGWAEPRANYFDVTRDRNSRGPLYVAQRYTVGAFRRYVYDYAGSQTRPFRDSRRAFSRARSCCIAGKLQFPETKLGAASRTTTRACRTNVE